MKNINIRISKSNNDKQRIEETSKKINTRNIFENNCFWLLIKAYLIVYSEKKYDHTLWNEDTYSANICREMKRLQREEKYNYFVHTQIPKYDEDFYKGIKKDTSYFYDIFICGFSFNIELELLFGFEAKILCEKDYLKKRSYNLVSEYVSSTGMDKFVKNLYKERGCMVGYVIQGKPDNIVENINNRLIKNNRDNEILQKIHKLFDYNYCYETEHNSLNYKIKHIMLLFNY